MILRRIACPHCPATFPAWLCDDNGYSKSGNEKLRIHIGLYHPIKVPKIIYPESTTVH